jgi:dienelactone hydrolase
MNHYMKRLTVILVCLSLASPSVGRTDDPPLKDRRGRGLRDLNGYFPMQVVEDEEHWKKRQAEIRRRILVSQGLWPLPTKSPLHAVIHGRVDRDDYVVDRVYFQSRPGHFVTGNLYRPKNASVPMPAILSPHGHWKDGRFYDVGDEGIKKEIESGAETSVVGGRNPIRARAVHLARMGCLVFVYDMNGYADSIQLPHRFSRREHLDRNQNWGFMSVQADLRLQNTMGLQTWNSIRALDFLLELEETDPNRLGVTGASGGGTQSMMIAAIDERIDAAMPCVMVSTSMQGGCTCENAPLLRIDNGNIDIAAAIAPRPLGLTAADDWTVELETKGFPDLVRLYEMLGRRDRLTGVFHTQFKHNYNQVNRLVMYAFFNRHFKIGIDQPIKEREYKPLSIEEATVWSEGHPKPSGDQVGDVHEVQLLRKATVGTELQMAGLIPKTRADLAKYREVVGGAWQTIIGRNFDSLGNVTFAEASSRAADQMTIRLGHVEYTSQQEQLPVVIYEPVSDSKGVVIHITDVGKSATSESNLNDRPLSLVNDGFTIITADLYGQGDFLPDGKPLDSQRLNSKESRDVWQKFSGYTYGYNHSLFALRVHDILTLIKYAGSRTDNVQVHGTGKKAGPIVAAACGLASDQVSAVVVEPRGFAFGNINRHDDPMFVPGAAKYLGVDGLLSLIAPTKLTVIGDTDLSVTRRVYNATDRAELLKHVQERRSQ